MIDRERMQLARTSCSAEDGSSCAQRVIDAAEYGETRSTFNVRRMAHGNAKRPEIQGHCVTRRPSLLLAALPDTIDIA
jgi:hypothetical protein